MSTSLLAFLTLLEKQTAPLLPTAKTWRFQRIIDFRAGQGVLQLWDGTDGVTPGDLAGQIELREARSEASTTPSFSGMIRSTVEGVGPQKFSFHPADDADVQRQAERLAEIWGRLVQ